MKVGKMSDKGFSRRQLLTEVGCFAAGPVGMTTVTGGGLDLLRKA